MLPARSAPTHPLAHSTVVSIRSPVKWSFFGPATILEAPQRTSVRGPTFIRLLARLTDADVPPPPASLPDRLSQWIDWTRAVALSRALGGTLPVLDGNAPAFDSEEYAACQRTRAGLTNTITLATSNTPGAMLHAPAPVDFSTFRQHYLAMQRAMQSATGKLRGQLRDRLASTSADMARLAEVDAMMEGVLSPREHRLLAAVPALLGQHFERLQQVTQGHATATRTEAWLELFRRDMQGVLLAELDVRFLPIEGLLAALRTDPQGRHVQTSA